MYRGGIVMSEDLFQVAGNFHIAPGDTVKGEHAHGENSFADDMFVATS